jgi:predicted nucleic acid-binding protein
MKAYVDTSALYAVLDADDMQHHRAEEAAPKTKPS